MTQAERRRTKRLSAVVPVYNGASTVAALVSRLHESLAGRYDLEVVLVNDGSPADDSAAVCRDLALRLPWVKFVDLARNFGEHNAVMAGLNHCSGDAAVVLDDDFQNPPAEVAKLVERLDEGYDVVFSRYEEKKHSFLRNLGSRFHNAVANFVLDKQGDLYLSSFKVLNRFLIDQVTTYTGPYPYVDGLILRTTRRYATQVVEHAEREHGRSGYTLRKLVRLWLAMFTTFSVLPLRIASLMGFAFAGVGFVAAALFAIEKLRNPDLPAGWASTIIVLLIVSGVQLCALGLIGEYLGRLFLHVSRAPQYVARETVNVESRKPGER